MVKPPPAVDVGRRTLARNTVLNVLGQGLPLVVALVAVPILLRGLGEARFGILGLVWMFVTIFGDIGFGRAGTRFAAEALGGGDTHHLGRIRRVTVSAQLALGVALGVALALSAGLLSTRVFAVEAELVEDVRRSFLLLAATTPALLAGAAYRGFLEAAQRFAAVNAVRFTVSTLNYLLPILVLWGGGGVVAVVATLMALRWVGTAGFWWAARKGTGTHVAVAPGTVERRADAPPVSHILGFGAWVTVSSVVSPVLVYMDRFLLGALVGVGAVGIYTAPYEVVTRILLIPAALGSTLFPAVSALQGMGDAAAMRRTARQAVGAVALLVAPVALLFMVLAGPLLSLWLGDALAPEMVTALRLLAPGVLFNALAFVPLSVLQGLGRADVTGRIHLVELPFHVVVAWWLIGTYGVAGAAGAWSLRTGVDALLMFVAARRVARR